MISDQIFMEKRGSYPVYDWEVSREIITRVDSGIW